MAPTPTAGQPSDRFPPGATVVLREVLDGRVRSARPLRVVEDDDRRFVGFLVPRSTVAWPRLVDGAQSQTPDQGWRLPLEEWYGPGSLFVVPAGAGFAAVAFFDAATCDPLGWKVDFFRPLRRWSLGFDTLDHAFDLLVDVDVASWQPKDEDDLAQLRRVGVLDAAELAGFDRERRRVEDLLRARSGPFGEGWTAWRPDPGWPPLTLPRGWDDVGGGESPGAPGRRPVGRGLRSGRGARVLDDCGRVLVDFDLDGARLIHGHAHPRLVEALTRQAALGWTFGAGHPAVGALGRRLGEGLPRGWSVGWAADGDTAAAVAFDLVDRAGWADSAVVDLRRDLARGWPPVLDDGAGAVVFGESLFAGLPGGAVAGPPDLFAATSHRIDVESVRGGALAATAAAETLDLLSPAACRRAASAAGRLRADLDLPGDGPFFRVDAGLRPALAEAGLLVGADGWALVPTTVEEADIGAAGAALAATLRR